MIKLYHPNLGQSIEVAESAVRIYERSGWIKQETAAEEARYFIASAGLSDTEVVEEPPVASPEQPELDLER